MERSPSRMAGSPPTATEKRCPRCSAPLDQNTVSSRWAISPFLRDSFAVIGTGVGGAIGGFYTFQEVMPRMVKLLPGRPWLQTFAGTPPTMLVAVAGAGLAGGALPAFAQLIVTTYHASSAFSETAVSKATVYVEEYRDKSSAGKGGAGDSPRQAR